MMERRFWMAWVTFMGMGVLPAKSAKIREGVEGMGCCNEARKRWGAAIPARLSPGFWPDV